MNWNKWIAELLPSRLRVVRLFILCKICVSYIIKIQKDFNQWKDEMYIRTRQTPQVRMLEKIISDRQASKSGSSITESLNKPYDFTVTVNILDLATESLIRTLLNRYKLAGKAYDFVNEEIGYIHNWKEYECEKAQVNHSFFQFVCEKGEYQQLWDRVVCESGEYLPPVWKDYVCEQLEKETIYYDVYYEIITNEYSITWDFNIVNMTEIPEDQSHLYIRICNDDACRDQQFSGGASVTNDPENRPYAYLPLKKDQKPKEPIIVYKYNGQILINEDPQNKYKIRIFEEKE